MCVTLSLRKSLVNSQVALHTTHVCTCANHIVNLCIVAEVVLFSLCISNKFMSWQDLGLGIGL